MARRCASSGVTPGAVPHAAHRAGAAPHRAAVCRAAVTTDGFTIAPPPCSCRDSLSARRHGRHGFDCSGLVQYVFALYGMRCRASFRTISTPAGRCRVDDLEPGDLVFFVTHGDERVHVGIVIGGDRFVHAPNSRGVVRVDSLASGYWGEHIAGARRMELVGELSVQARGAECSTRRDARGPNSRTSRSSAVYCVRREGARTGSTRTPGSMTG